LCANLFSKVTTAKFEDPRTKAKVRKNFKRRDTTGPKKSRASKSKAGAFWGGGGKDCEGLGKKKKTQIDVQRGRVRGGKTKGTNRARK